MKEIYKLYPFVKGEHGNPILYNADDFGFKPEMSQAILDLLQSGKIQRTTIMVNMPNAAEAFLQAKALGLQDRIGLHLNLTFGAPLTQNILSTRFCKNGTFNKEEVLRPRILLTKTERSCLTEEVQAQFDKYKELFGYYPKHMDSHHFTHTYPSVLLPIIGVARKCGTESMRISCNLFDKDNHHFISKFYKKIINLIIRSQFQSTDFFGNYLEYRDYFHASKEKTVEIMVHPFYKDGSIYEALYKGDSKFVIDFKDLE